MKGVIDASSENVRVIRLRRDGLLNRVRELDKRGIKELWSDPILRHSDVLDGLFHTKVVICEGDADCRFYSAIMDAQYGSGEQIVPDVMFTHCGGKGRIPTIVKALRSLDVQTIVVCDFDVLREEHPLKAMCEALGANWKADVEGDWRTVKRAVESKKSELASSEVASQIRTILNEVSQVSEVSESHFPQSAVDQIQKVLRSSSPWSIVKSTGKGYLPSGEASQAYGRLIKKLHLVGLFIVEVGELERFDTSIGGHGPRWVTSVLGKNLGEAPELAEARDFVSKLLKANPHYMG
jgi:hypothetical protein